MTHITRTYRTSRKRQGGNPCRKHHDIGIYQEFIAPRVTWVTQWGSITCHFRIGWASTTSHLVERGGGFHIALADEAAATVAAPPSPIAMYTTCTWLLGWARQPWRQQPHVPGPIVLVTSNRGFEGFLNWKYCTVASRNKQHHHRWSTCVLFLTQAQERR